MSPSRYRKETSLRRARRCFWYLWQTNRVLHNFSVFGGAIVTVAASVFALQNRAMDAGAVGLSITYAREYACEARHVLATHTRSLVQ